MLAVAEAIAARAQTPGKGAALSPWKIVKSVCLRLIFTACILVALVIGDWKCRLRTQIFFLRLLTMFVKENIYLSNKARSTIRRTFTKEKNSQTKGGGGEPPGPTSKSALVNNMCNVALPRSFTHVLSRFLSFLKNLYKSLLTSVFYVDLVRSWSILRDCSCHNLDCFIIRFFTVISFPYN